MSSGPEYPTGKVGTGQCPAELGGQGARDGPSLTLTSCLLWFQSGTLYDIWHLLRTYAVLNTPLL